MAAPSTSQNSGGGNSGGAPQRAVLTSVFTLGAGMALGAVLCYLVLSRTEGGSPAGRGTSGVDASAFTCLLGGCGDEPLGVVRGPPVRYVDLPPSVRQGLHDRVLSAWLDAREQVSAFAASIAIAKERGDSRPLSELPSLEEWVAAEPIEDAAVSAYFEANKASFGVGTTLPQVRDQIRQVLRNARAAEIKSTKTAELAASGTQDKIDLRLAPPRHASVPAPEASFASLRLPPGSVASAENIATQSDEGAGNPAEHWLVEFTPYACDTCGYSKLQVDDFLRTSKVPVRFVRLAAGPTDALTTAFAKGTYCAAKISPETHEAFDVRAFQPAPTGYDPLVRDAGAEAAAKAHVLRVAREAGVKDETAFDACLSSADANAHLEKVAAYARTAGAGGKGTTLLLNGQRVPGGASGLARFASWAIESTPDTRAQK
jgi:hypothetical protein